MTSDPSVDSDRQLKYQHLAQAVGTLRNFALTLGSPDNSHERAVKRMFVETLGQLAEELRAGKTDILNAERRTAPIDLKSGSVINEPSMINKFIPRGTAAIEWGMRLANFFEGSIYMPEDIFLSLRLAVEGAREDGLIPEVKQMELIDINANVRSIAAIYHRGTDRTPA